MTAKLVNDPGLTSKLAAPKLDGTMTIEQWCRDAASEDGLSPEFVAWLDRRPR